MSALVHVRQRGQPKRPDHNQQGARPPNSTLFGLRYKHRPPGPVSRHRLIQTSRGTPGGATVIARSANVTMRELMATIGHSSHVPALPYQHATAERSRAIADYLDGVIDAAGPQNRPPASASVREGCGMGVAWTEGLHEDATTNPCLRPGRSQRGGGRNRTAVRGFAVPCLFGIMPRSGCYFMESPGPDAAKMTRSASFYATAPRRIALRSVGVVFPQSPSIRGSASATSRHSCRTGQSAHSPRTAS